jgi:hypothetical protein
VGIQSITKARTASEDVNAASEAEAAAANQGETPVGANETGSPVTETTSPVVVKDTEIPVEPVVVVEEAPAPVVVTEKSEETESASEVAGGESSPTNADVETIAPSAGSESGSASPTITRPTIRSKKDKNKTDA